MPVSKVWCLLKVVVRFVRGVSPWHPSRSNCTYSSIVFRQCRYLNTKGTFTITFVSACSCVGKCVLSVLSRCHLSPTNRRRPPTPLTSSSRSLLATTLSPRRRHIFRPNPLDLFSSDLLAPRPHCHLKQHGAGDVRRVRQETRCCAETAVVYKAADNPFAAAALGCAVPVSVCTARSAERLPLSAISTTVCRRVSVP